MLLSTIRRPNCSRISALELFWRSWTLGWKQWLLLKLLLLLKMMRLSHVMLSPFQAGIWKITTSHTSKDHWNHVRRDASS